MQMSKRWICNAFLITALAVPAFAGPKDGSESKTSTTVAAASATGTENVTALLGVLVMKGVLAPA